MRRILMVVCLAVSTAGSGAAPTPAQDLTVQQFNDRLEQQVRQQIGARASERASAVFKNIEIEWLGTTAAGDFLGIMNRGYARALGVKCTHCHMEDDFASDDLRPKRAAREMARMHFEINQQLARMNNLEGAPQDRFVNCATCHRGLVDPREDPNRR